MYIGTDGKRYYNSRYDAIGYEPTMQEMEREKRIQFNRDIKSNRQAARASYLNNEMKEAQLEEAERNSYYEGLQQYAAIHGRAPGFQMAGGNTTPKTGKSQTVASNPASGYQYNVDRQAAEDAGAFLRAVKTGDVETALMTLNKTPYSGINNASGIGIETDDSGQPCTSDHG